MHYIVFKFVTGIAPFQLCEAQCVNLLFSGGISRLIRKRFPQSGWFQYQLHKGFLGFGILQSESVTMEENQERLIGKAIEAKVAL